MSEIKVSIYEDKKELRQSLELLINNTKGLKLVRSNSDCKDLKNSFDETVPDVILMDIDMPGRTGIEGVRILREMNASINVMMLTVFEDNDNIFNALKAGANGYLIKSTTPEKIIEGIIDLHNGGSPISASIARKILGALSNSKKNEKATSTKLSPREEELLKLLELGNSVKMVASDLGITYETARTHIRRIYEKLQVNSVTSALYKAKTSGWI